MRTASSISEAGEKGCTLSFSRDLFSATQIDCPSRPAFYQAFEPVLCKVIARADRAIVSHGIMSILDLRAADQSPPPQEVSTTLRIRDIINTEEEAFILTITRKYLKERFGQSVYAVAWPSFNEVTDSPRGATMAGAPVVVPDILAMFDEVAATRTVEPEDVRYYRRLEEALLRYDTLVEESALASQYGFLKIPIRAMFSTEESNGT